MPPIEKQIEVVLTIRVDADDETECGYNCKHKTKLHSLNGFLAFRCGVFPPNKDNALNMKRCPECLAAKEVEKGCDGGAREYCKKLAESGIDF